MVQSELRLDWSEVALAAYAGVRRRILSLKRASPEPYGKTGLDLWGMDIEACAAEMAVAKVAGKYWNAISSGRLKDLGGDVGRGIQVRSTQRMNGCLILHDRDDDDHNFFLVIGSIPTFRIPGWIEGHKGKDQRFWRNGDGRPAYFVPQSELNAVPFEARP